MVASRRRDLSSRLRSRSIDLSPLNQRQRNSRSRPCAPKDASAEAERTTATATHQTAAAPCCSEKLLTTAGAPTLPTPSSRRLLLACQICLRAKDAIRKPVVTFCGHLFCWRCLLELRPPEGISHDQVLLPCPVCDTPLCGGCPNEHLNTIIPILRKNDPVTDRVESDDEQPLPKPNSFPIWLLDEKVEIFHSTAQKLKSAEDHFISMLDEIKGTRKSFNEGIEKMMKSTERQDILQTLELDGMKRPSNEFDL